ncbi:MAG: class I SAM-dependent methyltransferase [Geminocystis sp.]|nr:class I SAM-dependent methyltransferase [Geminocystis sp.]
MAKSVANGVRKFISLERRFNLLDFGCGTGLVSFFLAEDVGHITGIDNSKAMVEVFNKKAKENNINAQAYHIELSQEELNQNFDVIVSSMTFHHIKYPVDILKKLYRALKEGGCIAVAELVKEDGTFHEENDGVEHFGFEIKDMEKFFQEAGFRDIKHDIIYTVEKERGENKKEYPVFIMVGRK